jgi:integrase
VQTSAWSVSPLSWAIQPPSSAIIAATSWSSELSGSGATLSSPSIVARSWLTSVLASAGPKEASVWAWTARRARSSSTVWGVTWASTRTGRGRSSAGRALPPRFRGLALVSAGAGLRPGEARGLTVPWFNFLKRELRVEQQLWSPNTGPSYMIRPKRGSVGTIPVGDAVVTGLAKHFEDFPPSTPIVGVSGQHEILVFTDDRGNPIRRQRWNDTWNRAAKVAELPPGTTPHDLRHYYASLLISKGASVTAVQTMLRHKTATETLNTYSHLWPEDNALVRRAVDAELSAVLGLDTTDPTADISRTAGSSEA